MRRFVFGGAPVQRCLLPHRYFFKGMFPKKDSPSNGDGEIPPIDPKGVQMIQEMLRSQTPERQKELMEQAMKLQQVMSKVPGFKKMSERQVRAMKEVMERQMSSTPPPHEKKNESVSASSAHNSNGSSTSSFRGSGPSLDTLRQMHLGDEIEALFGELGRMRNRKNYYREQHALSAAQAETAKAENTRLEELVKVLRQKLNKSEQEVLLLNTEVMDLQDKAKKHRATEILCRKLQRELDAAKQPLGTQEAIQQSPAYRALEAQLQHKEDALRSLQRRLGRQRRHDPLLQCSLVCSELETQADALSDSGAVASSVKALKEARDAALQQLRLQFQREQAKAWSAASEEGNVAALLLVHSCEVFLAQLYPHAHLDARLRFDHRHIGGDGGLARREIAALFTEIGLSVVDGGEKEGGGAVTDGTTRLCIKGPASGPLTSIGPYVLALAARLYPPTLSPRLRLPSVAAALRQAVVVPYVSEALLDNEARTAIEFEASRSSGPGGQALNVSETQIHAKVTVDGVPLFTTSSQDSRSALQNKKQVMEKVRGAKRKEYNQTLAGLLPETVQKQLTEKMATYLSQHSATRPSTEVLTREKLVQLVEAAVHAERLSPLQWSVVQLGLHLSQGGIP